MVEQWFSPEVARYFSLLALFALLACYQPLIDRGAARLLVLGSYVAAMGTAAVLFVAGLVALLAAQPVHVYGTLLFSGGLTAALLGYYAWRTLQAYGDAEVHRSVASDL